MREVSSERLSRGLVTKVAQTGLSREQAAVAQNVWFPRVGSFARRPGYQRAVTHHFDGECALLAEFVDARDGSRTVLAAYDQLWDTGI